MPWHPRVPTRWPSWNVPIAALAAVLAGLGMAIAPDVYTSGTYHYAASTLGIQACGLILIAAGLLALVFVNRYTAGILIAVLVAWSLTLVASVLGGFSETLTGPVWPAALAVAVIAGVYRRGTDPTR